MKLKYTITYIALLLFSTLAFGAGGNLPGSGTETDPYLIEDYQDFQVFCGDASKWATGVNVRLDTNIDLNPGLPGRMIYTQAPIAGDSDSTNSYILDGVLYSGVFDGDGHVLTHLNVSGSDFSGLFGQSSSSAIIKNLAIVDSSISGDDYVACIVGHNGGTISECYSEGTVIGADGLNYYLGGLVGYNASSGLIINCYSKASVSSGTFHIGGLVGHNGGNIVTSYSVGAISGDANIGGLVGSNSGSVDRSIWDTQTSNQSNSAGGDGKTTSAMQSLTTYLHYPLEWDFEEETANGTNDIWRMPPIGYPVLAWPNVTQNTEATITGKVFYDVYQDGRFDDASAIHAFADTGLAGFTVYCDLTGDGLTPDDIQDATEEDGEYVLPGIDITKTVTVCIQMNDTTIQWSTNATSVTVNPNFQRIINFPMYCDDVTVSGKMYFDRNGNGIQEVANGEIGLKDGWDWKIFVDTNNNGIRDAFEPPYATGIDGSYQLSLPLGSHKIIAEIPHIQSWPENVWICTVPENNTHTLQITDQSPIENINFGFKDNAESCIVFRDRNSDDNNLWDYCGIYIASESRVYEVATGGYPAGSYFDERLGIEIDVANHDGFQSSHTLGTWLKYGDNRSVRLPISEANAALILPVIQQTSPEMTSVIGSYFIENNARSAGVNNGRGFTNTYLDLDSFLASTNIAVYYGFVLYNNNGRYIITETDPIDFIVTDPQGRRVGHANGVTYNEIPNVYYSGDGDDEALIIPDYLEGDYDIELFGLGEDYIFKLHTLDAEGNMQVLVDDSATLAVGATKSLTISMTPAKYSGGSGTETDPYQIATKQDLLDLGANTDDYDKHFIMTADIDLAEETFTTAVIAPDTGASNGYTFNGTPFSGVFNGNGHIIKYLKINDGEYYCGLFGKVNTGSTIKALGLQDISISCSGGDVGGMIGENFGFLSECFSTGAVNGAANIGLLIGSNNGGIVENCYSKGTVGCNVLYAGGLIGGVYAGSVTNCFTSSVVNGNTSGGFTGYNRSSSGIINCFWDMEECGIYTGIGEGPVQGVLSRNTTEMQTLSTFTDAGWDFVDTDGDEADWQMPVGDYPRLDWETIAITPTKYSGGSGTEADPYQIATKQDLLDLGANTDDYDKHFIMTTDIDLDGETFTTAIIAPDNDNTNWEFDGNSFTGNFNGNGLIITNLTIDADGTTNECLGLFGGLNSADVYNLGIVNCSISGGYIYLGGLCGYNDSGTISNCYAEGSIASVERIGGLCGGNDSGTITYCHAMVNITGGNLSGLFGGLCGMNNSGNILNSYADGIISAGTDASSIGGLCGHNESGSITNCYATGNVSAGSESSQLGGLCGYSYDGNITDCHSTGKVSGGEGADYVGGLCGYNEIGTITKCFALGAISTGIQSSRVGGLCGCNYGIITNSYATGSVSGDSDSYDFGGLCGENYTTITKCYSTGNVMAYHSIGGLCGKNVSGTIADCYAKGTVSGIDIVGGLCGENASGTITNCYATGNAGGVSETWYLGGFCGFNGFDNSGTISSCFWDTQTSGLDVAYCYLVVSGGYSKAVYNTFGVAEGKTTTEMQTLSTFTNAGWDFVDTDGDEADWQMPVGDYPRLAWETIAVIPTKYSGGNGTEVDPYQIATKQDLLDLGANTDDYDKHFIMTTDIDLTGEAFTAAVIAPDIISGYDYQGTEFSGTFDGNKYIIKKLSINGGYNHYLGLFGKTSSSARILELGVENFSVTSGDEAENLGGLVGDNRGIIIRCYTIGVVAGDCSLGGLVGHNGGTIISSYTYGSVTGVNDSAYLGGFVGDNDEGIITCCYANNSVIGGEYSFGLGGLAGYNDGTIVSCYSTGSVTVGENSVDFGGLVGGNTIGILNACFWDVQRSGVGAAGDNNCGAIGKTTTEMQTLSTFIDASWDFVNETANGSEDIWQMPAGDYPRLAWETVQSSDASWQLVSNMITARDQFAGCLIGDEIFVFGGNSNPNGVNLKSGERYNINSNTWTSIADNPRFGTGLGIEEVCGIAYGGKFYVFGGWGYQISPGQGGTINFNEVYDPATNSWTQLAQKPTLTQACSIAVYNDEIYLFGGQYADDPGNEINYAKVEAYNPSTNTWRHVTDMPKTLMGPAIAVNGDYAYVIGGYEYSTDSINTEVMAYNFVANSWTRNYCTVSADATRAYSYASQTPSVDGKVYLIGGREGTSFANNWISDKFTVFDITAKTFESKEALPQARSGHLVVTHNGIPYVIGGFSEDENYNRAQSTVYAYTSSVSNSGCNLDITGDYWEGFLGSDISISNQPGSETGIGNITDTTVTLSYLEDDGSTNTDQFDIVDQYVDADGWVNLEYGQSDVTKTIQVMANNTLVDKINRQVDDNMLGRTLLVKKAVAPTVSDVAGEYAYFGHFISANMPAEIWACADYGTVDIGSNGTVDINVTCTNSGNSIYSTTWNLNSSSATIDVSLDATETFNVGKNGILVQFDINPSDTNTDLFYSMLVKKSSGKTLADLEGQWLVQEYGTDSNNTSPYTIWTTLTIDADGSYTMVATDWQGQNESKSGTITIEADGDLVITNQYGLTYNGVLSADNNTVVTAIMGQYDDVGISIAVRKPECMGSPDMSGDGKVDLVDFAMLAAQWLDDTCVDPDWCSGSDINRSGDVGIADLQIFAEHWLEGTVPGQKEYEIVGDWELVSNSGPSARHQHSMVYDPARNVVVLFGGRQSDNSFLNDTWEWNGAQWTEVSDTVGRPSARYRHSMVYDITNKRIIMVGGFNGSNLNDTWAYDGSQWTNITPTQNNIPPRQQAALAFDENKENILFFGGENNGYQQDTWVFDNNSWVNVSSSGPGIRAAAGLVYSDLKNKMVMFGGDFGSWNFRNDLWIWDGISWAEIQTNDTKPSKRCRMGFVNIPSVGIFLLGGYTGRTSVANDFWMYDGQSWIDLTSQYTLPTQSMGFSMCLTPDGILVFGGCDNYNESSTINETWLLEIREKP